MKKLSILPILFLIFGCSADDIPEEVIREHDCCVFITRIFEVPEGETPEFYKMVGLNECTSEHDTIYTNYLPRPADRVCTYKK